jgi:O-antigen ligase
VSTESVRFRFIRTDVGARVVNAVLALTILVSPVAFIEPSPYEGMVFILALVVFAFGLPFERRILPLLFLLTVWAAAGFASLIPAFSDADAVRYYLISVYLMVSAVVFACLFAEGTMGRLATLGNAYIVAAAGVSLVAIAAYFGAIPRADSFLVNGRAAGTFKDPNVFAPYLILPLLLLIERTIYRGIGLARVAATLIILFALFLSFSRGAWAQFVLSAAIMMGLLFFTDGRAWFRTRLVVTAVAAVAGAAMLLAVALSIPSVQEMFEIRAELFQSYDAGQRTSRFSRQLDAVRVVVENPNGLGPLQFGRQFGQDVHNVYLNAFVSYGWVGGFAYLAIIVMTLTRGLRAILVSSPWRGYLVPIYASFVGVVAEGLIVDTDHWRHFFLLTALIWGLAAATARYRLPVHTNGVTGAEIERKPVKTTRRAAAPHIERAGRSPA